MPYPLQEERKLLEEVFAQMDADYSGYLSRDEIGDLLEQVRENERKTSRLHTENEAKFPRQARDKHLGTHGERDCCVAGVRLDCRRQ